ncbi:MAG: hypothetical protein HC844_01205 [Tabrizicola sp.]|nr:hypothetical protein [Tabrizicola sp.]
MNAQIAVARLQLGYWDGDLDLLAAELPPHLRKLLVPLQQARMRDITPPPPPPASLSGEPLPVVQVATDQPPEAMPEPAAKRRKTRSPALAACGAASTGNGVSRSVSYL